MHENLHVGEKEGGAGESGKLNHCRRFGCLGRGKPSTRCTFDEGKDGQRLCVTGHVERKERYRIAKRVYVGEYAGSRSVGIQRKRCNDTVKECLKKRGLNFRKARRMVQDRSDWRGNF